MAAPCVVERSLDATAAALGRDGDAYRRTIGTVVDDWPRLERAVLGPLARAAPSLRRSRASGCGRCARRQAWRRARSRTSGRGRCLPASPRTACCRSIGALTAGVGLALGAMCHVAGWPIPRGGAQRDYRRARCATCSRLAARWSPDSQVATHRRAAAGQGRAVRSVAAAAAPDRRPHVSRARTGARSSGIATAWACSRWTGRSRRRFRGPPTECRRAGTVHLGGTLDEIAASETAAWRGRIADRPFVLLSQPTLFDPSRAPAGKHVAWGYCHVPRGIDRRHARPHRAADRAIRARLPRLRARAIGDDAGRHRSAQRQLSSAATSPPA